jgi:hypothetical protein
VVADAELAEFGAASDWISRLGALSLHQRKHWPMLAGGHATRAAAQVRRFEYDGFEVRTQFNPGRMASAAAKVDAKSLRERKCFLCPPQLPTEQKGFRYGDYLILCNPFPILDEHFTIPHIEHRPQAIADSFGDYVRLIRDLGSHYSVLYNGPLAGASAPDHLHFQAGTRGWMPVDTEYASVRDRAGRLLQDRSGAQVWAVSDYLRPIVSIEGTDASAIHAAFERLHAALRTAAPGEAEPMMNIISWFDAGTWTILVFPRGRHRPACFFEEGEARILVSPGAVA